LGTWAPPRLEDFPIVIATRPANVRQRKIAFVAFVLLVVIVALTIPFANIHLARVDAFVPISQTVMCVADLLTTVFLFAQYSVQPQGATLALASGYMFSGLFAFLQTLAFPGAYAPAGLIGDTLNSPRWLFVVWHTSFPLAIVVYTLLKDASETANRPPRSTGGMVGITIAGVVAASAGLTWAATRGVVYLPKLYENALGQTPFAHEINLFLMLQSTVALVLLLVRRRTILDEWLAVTLFAWLPNFIVSVLFTGVRFTVGWYAARIYALIAGSSLAFALLAETVVLYIRLSDTVVLLRRERENKLLSAQAITAAIAHEIRQPLSGIVSSAGAAIRLLDDTRPDRKKVRDILEMIVSAGHRAGDVFDGFQALFGGTDSDRKLLDVNQLFHDVLLSLRSEIEGHDIKVLLELLPTLPLVEGNGKQLQEVIFNLIINAIQAMAATTDRSRILRIKTLLGDDDTIAATVEDSGPGIDPTRLDSIFHAFVTTKLHGMGLGLAICRMVVNHHGGKLTASSDGKTGSMFQLNLPLKSVIHEFRHPGLKTTISSLRR
jgi:signal transduction histidine kinase